MFLRPGLLAALIALTLAAPSIAATTPELGSNSAPPLIIADLDGDHKLDVAVGSRSGNSVAGFFYRIDIGLSGSAQSSSFTIFDRLATGLNVTMMDLDGDHDLDFVITSLPLRHPIGVWINDGTGRFQRGEASLYSSSIWTERQDIQNLPTAASNDVAETGSRLPAFHLVVFARAQIPQQIRQTYRLPEILAAPSVSIGSRPPLRAPPANA
jgi:hypothetical protein